jgi:hypothetical protein
MARCTRWGRRTPLKATARCDGDDRTGHVGEHRPEDLVVVHTVAIEDLGQTIQRLTTPGPLVGCWHLLDFGHISSSRQLQVIDQGTEAGGKIML